MSLSCGKVLYVDIRGCEALFTGLFIHTIAPF